MVLLDAFYYFFLLVEFLHGLGQLEARSCPCFLCFNCASDGCIECLCFSEGLMCLCIALMDCSSNLIDFTVGLDEMMYTL